MNMTKSLILGSAAALLAMGGAQAADLPVKAKAVEYVRICSLYGAGFYYMPGTDTCIKLGGYVRLDMAVNGGDYNIYQSGAGGARNRLSNYWNARARTDLTIDTRTATEYGVVRTYSDLVFSYTTASVVGSPGTAIAATDIGGLTSGGIGQAGLGMYHAFIQFAGFTIGRTYSIFDTPWQSYPAGGPDNIPGGSNHVTGVPQLTYTADFGQGISGSVSAQDPSGGQDTSNVFNLSQPTAASLVGGAYGAQAAAGTRIPDILGQVRVDQAWGLFQLAGVLHNNHASYYGATEATGHPNDKLGFAITAGLSIKNIPTGPGDTINMNAVYTDGATKYNFQSLLGSFAMYGGTNVGGAYQSLGLGTQADATFTTGTGLETVKTWGFRGGYTHNWNPNWASAIYGGYAQLQYGGNGKAAICANLNAGLGLALANCNPDFNMAVLGFNTVWTPVKNLAFTADVNATWLDQKHSGTITGANTANAALAKPVAVYELKDQMSVSALFRAQRNF